MRILNFGSLNIDMTYIVDHIVNEGETMASLGYQEFIGGEGLNQSIAIKRAGLDLVHAGCVGASDGDQLIAYLTENGVETRIEILAGNSGHVVVQINENGGNSIIVEGGANKKISREFIDEVLGDYEKGDYLITQNEINNLPYLTKTAHDKGMKVFFNPSPIDQVLYELDYNNIDCLIFNEIEGEVLAGSQNPDEIIEFFRQKFPHMEIILTLGPEGGIYYHDGEKIKFSSPVIDVIDTTGAGDTFFGYFVASQAKGLDIKESLKLASSAAALACKELGTSNSIPTMDTVNKFMQGEEK